MDWRKESRKELAAYLAGSGVLLLFWLLYWALAGSLNPFMLVNGADGLPDLSKIQMLAWTRPYCRVRALQDRLARHK